MEVVGPATAIRRLLIRLTIVFRMNGAFQGSYKNAPKKLYKAGDSIPLYYDAAEPQKNIAETHLKYAKDAYWKIPLTFALIVGGVIVLCLLIVLYATFFR